MLSDVGCSSRPQNTFAILSKAMNPKTAVAPAGAVIGDSDEDNGGYDDDNGGGGKRSSDGDGGCGGDEQRRRGR